MFTVVKFPQIEQLMNQTLHLNEYSISLAMCLSMMIGQFTGQSAHKMLRANIVTNNKLLDEEQIAMNSISPDS